MGPYAENMKIAFIGKGGSGKTTVTSLFAQFLAERRLPVLAIDADINQHLAQAIGRTADEAAGLPPMGIEIDRVKNYFRGDASLFSKQDFPRTAS